MKSGKPRKDWGPAEIAGYNALFLGAIQDWTQAEHRQLANYDRMEPTARSTPAYVGGQSNYVPVQPQVNNQGSGVNPYNPYQHVNAGEHWGNPYNPYQNGW